MADKPKRGGWTPEEVKREEDAQRARVRRDAARGVSRNLENAVAHTEFAERFAEAFRLPGGHDPIAWAFACSRADPVASRRQRTA